MRRKKDASAGTRRRDRFLAACLAAAGWLCALLAAEGQQGPITVSTTSGVWGHVPFAVAQEGDFTAEIDAMPLAAGADAGVGLTYAPGVSDFNRLACVVRFNQQNGVDVRDGGGYRSTGVTYRPNVAYHLKFRVYIPRDTQLAPTYAAYLTPAGGSQIVLGTGLSFRSGQAPVPSLCGFACFADVGSMKVWNPCGGSSALTANSIWTTQALPRQTGSFRAVFDAVPLSSGEDYVVGLSKGAQTSFAGYACLVRFTTDGHIQARDAGTYPASTMTYVPGRLYRFVLDVDIPNHRYGVTVTPAGGTGRTLGTAFRFRTEQAAVTSLDHLGAIIDSASGSGRLANVALRGGLDRYGVLQLNPTIDGGREYFARWDNGVARTLTWGMDRYDPEFHARGDGTLTIDGQGICRAVGEAPRLYVYDPVFEDSMTYAPDRFKLWRNTEVTVYFQRVNDQNIEWAGMVVGAHIRHIPDSDLPGDRGYYGKLYNQAGGVIGFVKEVYHHDSANGYPWRDSRTTLWDTLPYNRWIGFKYICRDSGSGVKLEIWVDPSAQNCWTKLDETRDDGGWGTDAPSPGPGIDPAQILSGPNLSVFIRNDGLTGQGWLYKRFSVREIAAE